ncbi:MAG: thioredoxin [Lachnospiraceae bacterium]|nr:thioredoxin [Lachnospiraceae bacterium]
MKDRKKITVNLIRIIALLLAVSFILIGIYRGEHGEVLRKAVKICLECIGIG